MQDVFHRAPQPRVRATSLALFKSLSILLLHAGFTVLFAWPIVIGARTFVRNGNSADQSFAWMQKILVAIKQGEIALWDFSTMAGVSFIGELQTSPLYPPAWIYGLLSSPGSWRAFDFFLLFHFLLASLGTHYFCNRLGLRMAASLFAALTFAFGSMYSHRVGGQPNLFASLSWLPWIVAAAHAALSSQSQAGRASAAIATGMAVALSFLAGHVHAVLLAIMSAAAYAPAALAGVPGWAQRLKRLLLAGLVAGGVAMALSLTQIEATQEYLKLAYKWYGAGSTEYPHVVPLEVFAQYAAHPADLLSIVFPRWQGPIDGGTLFFTFTGLFCLLASVALRNLRNDLRAARACSVALVFISVSFALSSMPVIGWLYYHIPILNLIRTPSRGLFAFGFAASILVGLGVEVILQRLSTWLEKRGHGVPVRPLQAAGMGLIAVLTFELWLQFSSSVEFPPAGKDIELAAMLDGAAVGKLLDLTGRDAPVYRYFADRADIPPNLGNLKPVLSAGGYRSSRPVAFHRYFDFNPHSSRMDALGVKWWITRTAMPDLPLVASVDGVNFYERPSALPVFWQPGPNSTRMAPNIAAVDWGMNEVRLTLREPVSGKLVFAQTPFPGFKAIADGQTLAVGTYEDLMAIDLAQPSRTIRFIYDPAWFWTTVDLAIATLFLSLFYWVFAFAQGLNRLGDQGLLHGKGQKP